MLVVGLVSMYVFLFNAYIIGMVGNTYYHPRKDPTLTSTGMVGHTYYHLGKGPNTYIH